jgi:hypothetical protein
VACSTYLLLSSFGEGGLLFMQAAASVGLHGEGTLEQWGKEAKIR